MILSKGFSKMNRSISSIIIIASVISAWIIGGHRQLSFLTEKKVDKIPSSITNLKIELQPRRPNFDPYGQSFHEINDKKQLSCQEASGKNVAVILSMGQSNSTNETELTSRYKVRNNVFNLNIFDGKCYQADDPLLGPTGIGGSFLSRLGDLLIDNRLYSKVLIIPIAHGNSFAVQWAPEGNLFPRVSRALNLLKKENIKITHILWQQGEAEGGLIDPDTEAYKKHVRLIVESVRKENVKAPFYIAQSTVCKNASNDFVRAAQTGLNDKTIGIYLGPDTDIIPISERFDGCHLSQAGLNHMAQLWFDVIRKNANTFLSNELPLN